MKNLTKETIPCWYELSWQAENLAILLKIHQDFIEESKPISQTAPIVRELKDFNFPDFSGDFNKDLGFGGILEFINEKNGFNEFLIRIPPIRIETDEECVECKGSGQDDNEECLYCDGTGRKIVHNWRTASMISASLSILTNKLCLLKKDTSSKLPQLMTVITTNGKDGRGYSISGSFSIPFRKWLNSLGSLDENEYKFSQMIQAMKTSYGQMLGLEHINKHNFSAYVIDERGLLHASCPGNACGIDPSDGYNQPGVGYNFDCHNISNVAQQLTLFAGLATIHDQAREEIEDY
ncbi:MAG: hypothetical protein KJI70_01435 [Patescibacteria group bacterium]|nr:hypothetical protein [Patescibacteria group bacterium]